jgi:hypothetical protein
MKPAAPWLLAMLCLVGNSHFAAEQTAQGQHEQREQQVLHQRHERETKAVVEAHPRSEPQHQPAKPDKPADPPPNQAHGRDGHGKDKDGK